MTGLLDRGRTMRQHAWRLRAMARELEPRLGADLMRIAADLEDEALELETAVGRIVALSE
jgi:hypothetical protein